jgi:hypothetical protein
MAADVPAGWEQLDDVEFFFHEVVAPGKGEPDRRFDPGFDTFLVHVKSDSDVGGRWNNDPLSVLREVDGGRRFRVEGEDVKVITLRVNAEVPANPKYTRSLVSTYSGSTTVVIVHFKDNRDS